MSSQVNFLLHPVFVEYDIGIKVMVKTKMNNYSEAKKKIIKMFFNLWRSG